ncbi:uncharacterized protein LOC114280407 [Camellia sinensis]|uniref:uncharacterized protein LOC114280407 n=1 Tax=Camellia sinensis TaxID=4442 RepID=UPI0010358D7C|nr:uncharacterized protein LOC114280407 [Camellia sinensis]
MANNAAGEKVRDDIASETYEYIKPSGGKEPNNEETQDPNLGEKDVSKEGNGVKKTNRGEYYNESSLQRALSGLKQAPRAWFAKFSSTAHDFGFISSSYDSAPFVRTTIHGTTFLLLYVDDMIITGDDAAGILSLKQYLNRQFEMKDLGTLNYLLGLEISYDSTGYYLLQAKYASYLLAHVGLTGCKTTSTPVDPQTRLTSLDGDLLSDAILYHQFVGSLVYLTVTRPDLAYAVHLVSQYMSAPRTPHYAALLRILCYLKGTLFHGLHYFASSSLKLRAFSNADWAGNSTDRRSTTGFCFFLGILFLLGAARSNLSLLALVQKLNTELLLILLRNFCGSLAPC